MLAAAAVRYHQSHVFSFVYTRSAACNAMHRSDPVWTVPDYSLCLITPARACAIAVIKHVQRGSIRTACVHGPCSWALWHPCLWPVLVIRLLQVEYWCARLNENRYIKALYKFIKRNWNTCLHLVSDIWIWKNRYLLFKKLFSSLRSLMQCLCNNSTVFHRFPQNLTW